MKDVVRIRPLLYPVALLILLSVASLPLFFTHSSTPTTSLPHAHLQEFAPNRRSGWPSYQDSGDTIPQGILTEKPVSFFRQIQQAIDARDDAIRCATYGFPYDSVSSSSEKRQRRRIFYGSLIANEPWELFEIVSAEAYGIYEGIVLVESNRTQDTTPRGFHRSKHRAEMQQLFGPQANIQIRQFVNEDLALEGLNREHEQRQEIVQGWLDLGMQEDDVGILADADETFHRDFLRALQVCQVPHFLYKEHDCRHVYAKLRAQTQVFETTPECPRIDTSKVWYHPDAMIGGCIQGVADPLQHPPAPRQHNSFQRAPGFGVKCGDFLDQVAMITDGRFPAWDAADFRRTCGGSSVTADVNNFPSHGRHTAFHFHNFLSNLNATRSKHFTYGHPNKKAFEQHVQDLGEDYKMMYRCVKGMPDTPDQKWLRQPGGLEGLKPFLPIYFQDGDYRRRRHQHVLHVIELDETIYGNHTSAT